MHIHSLTCPTKVGEYPTLTTALQGRLPFTEAHPRYTPVGTARSAFCACVYMYCMHELYAAWIWCVVRESRDQSPKQTGHRPSVYS